MHPKVTAVVTVNNRVLNGNKRELTVSASGKLLLLFTPHNNNKNWSFCLHSIFYPISKVTNLETKCSHNIISFITTSRSKPTSFSCKKISEKIYLLHEWNKLRSKHQQKAFKIIQSIINAQKKFTWVLWKHL